MKIKTYIKGIISSAFFLLNMTPITALAENCVTTANPIHEYEGRASYYYYYGYQYNAKGSGQYIGDYYGVTSLKEISPNYWVLAAFCPTVPINQSPVIESMTVTSNSSMVTISGTATDADNDLALIRLQFNDGEIINVNANSDGSWTAQRTYNENGNYTITAVAIDSEDNTSTSVSKSYTITIAGDEPPVITENSVTVNGTSVTFYGTATDANNNLDRVVLNYNGANDIVIALDNSGDWLTTITNHPYGDDFTLTVQAFDSDNLPSEISTTSYTIEESTCATSGHIDQAALSQFLTSSWWGTPFTYNDPQTNQSVIAHHGKGLDSVIIKHCGEILVEEYFNGYTSYQRHELQSATKTISAMLIGIAMDKGFIPNDVNTKLSTLLPAQYSSLFTGQIADITLKHLLTMTSGLKWADYPGTSFDEVNAAADSVQFLLSEGMSTDFSKGLGKFFYNTGSSHLLSAIIHYNTPGSTAEFAEEHLFGPLGITDYVWNATKDSINRGGWDSFMKPKDFAKFSQMQLDEGKWQGQQVISESYVNDMTTYHVSNGNGGGYGYQMWIETDYGSNDLAGARGYGGQENFVLEEEGITVTFTGSNEENFKYVTPNYIDVKAIIKDYIVPAHTGNSHVND